MGDGAVDDGAIEGEAAIPQPAPPELDFEAFQRIYGPIRALSPAEAATVFDGAPFRWWVAGGWSVELGAEPRRFHEVIRVGVDGVPYQRPEISLLFKARRRWEKDEADFAAVVPLLESADRAWLRNAIALTEPSRHPWLERLG